MRCAPALRFTSLKITWVKEIPPPLAGCDALDAPLTLAWRESEDSLPAQAFTALLQAQATR